MTSKITRTPFARFVMISLILIGLMQFASATLSPDYMYNESYFAWGIREDTTTSGHYFKWDASSGAVTPVTTNVKSGAYSLYVNNPSNLVGNASAYFNLNGKNWSMCWYQNVSVMPTDYAPLIDWRDSGVHNRLQFTLFKTDMKYQIRIESQDESDTLYSDFAMSLNTYYHHCVVYDKDTFTTKYYINGMLNDSNTQSAVFQMGGQQDYYTALQWGNQDYNWNGNIDEWLIWEGYALLPDEVQTIYLQNYSGGSPPPAFSNAININTPTASQVITNYSTYFNFNISSNAGNYEIGVYVDGVLNDTITANNNTNYIYWLNFSEGQHTLLLMNTSNSSINDSVTFRLRYFNFTTEYNKNQDEIRNIPINITLNYPTELSVNRVVIEKNYSLNYTATNSSNKWTYNIQFPLALTNNSVYNLGFYLNFTTPDGIQINTTNETTHLIYTHYPNHMALSHKEIVEGADYTAYAYITTPLASASTIVSFYENDSSAPRGTDTTGTGTTNKTFSYNIPATSITLNETKNVTYVASFTFQGKTRNMTYSPPVSIVIYRMNFSTCATGGLVVYAKDEQNNEFLDKANYSIKLESSSGTLAYNFSFYINNTANATVCPTPSNVSILADIDIIIFKKGYEKGEKAINNRLINNTIPSPYYVYLITTGRGTVTTIKALGTYDEPLENYIIRVQKYFYDETAYIEVFSARTDNVGKIVPYLNWYNTYYKYIVSNANGQVIDEFAPAIVDSTPILLRTGTGATSFTNVYYGIQHNCTYNNATKILRCSVIDNSDTVTRASLRVYRNVVFSTETLCFNNATGSSITLICDLSTSGANSFSYVLTAQLRGYSPHILQFGEILKKLSGDYGATGYFMGFLVTGGLALIGLGISAPASILFGVVGFVVSGISGLFPLGNPAESGTILASVVIIAGILIILIRR